MSRVHQTDRVRVLLTTGSCIACGTWMYRNGLPNGRTRAGEIAEQLGMDLASELCGHREPGDPPYHDYWLTVREPKQLTIAI